MACLVSSVVRASNFFMSDYETQSQVKTVRIKVDDPLIRPQQVYACIYTQDEEIPWEQSAEYDGKGCELKIDLSHAAPDRKYKIMGFQWIANAWRCVSLVNGNSTELAKLAEISLEGFSS